VVPFLFFALLAWRPSAVKCNGDVSDFGATRVCTGCRLDALATPT